MSKFRQNMGKSWAGPSFVFLVVVVLGSSGFSLAKTWRHKQTAPKKDRAIALLSSTQTLPLLPPIEEAPSPQPLLEQPAAVPAPPAPSPIARATPQILQQGNQIRLNGQSLPGAWMQWQEGNTLHTGLSDTAARRFLGIELLDSQNPDVQPLGWFSASSTSPIYSKTLFQNPYRYLDLTELATRANWQVQIAGDTLRIDSPPAKIVNIREGRQSWGQRIVVDLDGEAVWQVSQSGDTGKIAIAGTADSPLLKRYNSEKAAPNKLQELLAPFTLKQENPPSAIAKIEPSGPQTTLHVKIPQGKGLKVSTLSDRLVIDLTTDPFVERDILWQPGLRWQQQWLRLGNSRFPAVFLELDPRSGAALRPIWSDPHSMTGIEPLVTTGRTWEAVAAINGGFFNRNLQLPLGALRRDERWFSGPILHRGAIAWDDGGNLLIDRLHLQETLTIQNGQRLPIAYLNSGYVQAGLSRYTPDWGQTYTPLTDNETIVLVQGNLVTHHYPGGQHGQTAFPIPPDGYLLTLRANSISPQSLAVGTQVNLESQTIPETFANAPQIMGAGPLLVKNRQIVLNAADEKFSAAFNGQAASRSVIATTDRGTIILAAIHRSPEGPGPTLAQLAQLMQRWGVVDALNLDGGSSTSLYLGGQLIDRDPSTAARVHNGIGVYLPPAR